MFFCFSCCDEWALLESAPPYMKIATFNVNLLRKRLPIVLQWLEHHQPDVLCLQETKVQDSEFPLAGLAASGYEVSFRGMKSYNGVAVLSRTKPEEIWYGFDDGGEVEDARLLRVVIRGIPIVSTDVPQGFEIDSPKYQYKLAWYDRLRNILRLIFRRRSRRSGVET